MGKTADLFRTYIWIIDTVRRAGKISLEELNQRWLRTDMSMGNRLPYNTFRRHLMAIEEMFDVTIEVDHRDGKRYSISNRDGMMGTGVRHWLLSTMTVAGAVRDSRSLQKRIVLEQVPSGDLFLTRVTRAMEAGKMLRVRYQKFVDAEPYDTLLEPYCLKLFRQRWYLLAHRPGRSYLAMYALDRMLQVSETTEDFRLPPQFDAAAYFHHMFGVFQPNATQQPTPILIRTYDGEWNYLRTLPLHPSQVELPTIVQQEPPHPPIGGVNIGEEAPTVHPDASASLHPALLPSTPSVQPEASASLHPALLPSTPTVQPARQEPAYVDFRLYLYPTFDFKMELLSRGAHVEVLSPPALRDELHKMLHDTLRRYERGEE